MRYALPVALFLLLATTADVQAQMNIRKAEPASNSVRSVSSNDLIRDELDSKISAANKKINQLTEQLRQTTEALNAVNERLAIAEGTLQQTTACAAEGRIFNGSLCVDVGGTAMISTISGGPNGFVAAQDMNADAAGDTGDVVAPISTTPPATEDVVDVPPIETIGGSMPAEADTDSVLPIE